MTLSFYAFALFAFTLANRLRGTQSGGDIMLAVLWALACSALGYDKLESVLSGLFMFLAQLSTWGAIWGAIGGWFKGEYKAPLWIKWLLKPLEGNPKKWGHAAAILRGLHFVPVMLVLGNAGAGLGLALSFYVTYVLGIIIEKKMNKRDSWELSEFAFGFGAMAVLITSGG